MIRLALLATALFATGCTILQSDLPPQQIYILRATGDTSAQAYASGPAQSSNGTLSLPSIQVPRPSADPGLGTELITLVRSDRRLDYYAGSRWADDLPEVVETLAIDTLRASGNWSAVHASPSPYFADYLLDINIRRFEADYTQGDNVAPTVHVVLDCTVARRRGRDLVATFSASAAVQAAENRLGAVVAAFEEAANAALAIVSERSASAVRSGN
jgi:cholesterol transport system auxiliary component